MTRGVLIGEIVDELSNLNNQVILRGALQLFDLNKVSEDFFNGLLNRIYGYNLKNLNAERSNEPGIDLGDEARSIAFQVTSQADSAKVNKTFESLKPEQKAKYKIVKVLIIGYRQGSYTGIHDTVIKEFQHILPGKKEPENFETFNIVDTKDLLRDIVSLEFKAIHEIYKYIKSEIQRIIIELEIPQADGKYKTSILHRVEVAPQTKAQNGKVILSLKGYEKLTLAEINTFFDALASISRITRELYFFIIQYGAYDDCTFSIYFDEAWRRLGVSPEKLQEEAAILERKRLIMSIDEEEPKLTLRLAKEEIGEMLYHIKEQLDVNKFVVSLDFTQLDEQEITT